ncbi:FAD-binding oxidoreductase [Pseudomonas sp. CGJS7]|uniref:FAD-binding oxidoreductase n=1 Tax=Pseudomonas sp. CGJS7 TaxID=3109348 RepID=UPI00300880AF
MEPNKCESSADDYRVFERSLEGKVRSRHHAEYASWHSAAAWNRRKFGRYPEYIVRATCIVDVVDTIRFARSHGLTVSVKGSGHSYAGCFLRDNGILLDLSLLDELKIDPERNLAMAGPGVTAAQLTQALARHALAFPTGHGGGVGLGGFLLGGGLGINCDGWGGMSANGIVAVDVVTADGEVLRADSQRHSDVLWAARGAGPCTFFVVTRFHVRCQRQPRVIRSYVHRVLPDRLAELTRSIAASAIDPALQVMLVVGGVADSAETGEVAVQLSATAFCDSADEAERMHRQLLSAASPMLEVSATGGTAVGFETIYRQTDAMMLGKRYRADNIVTDDGAHAARLLLERFARRPSPSTAALMIRRPPCAALDGAFSVSGDFFVSTYAQWNEAADDERNRIWLKSLYDALEPSSTGCYINEFDLEQRSAALSRCFSAEAWARLRAVRDRRDPDRVFDIPLP